MDIKFSVTLFNTTANLKVVRMGKLNEYYHHIKFDIFHVYSVRENRNVKAFATYEQSAGQLASGTNTDHYIDSHISCK